MTEKLKNDRCVCLTKEWIPIRYEVIGYGRELSVGVDFARRRISTKYDYHCDSGTRKSITINHCPFCGRKLDEVENADTEKLKPCINDEGWCKEWRGGCPCRYYKSESEG